MRPIVIAHAVLLLTGCASMPQAPAASQAEIEAASRAYLGCLYVGAERMDDGTSDAMSVGAAVAAACHSELAAVAETRTRGPMSTLYVDFLNQMKRDEAADGARAVLMVRQARR
jgi:uncharacterized protein YceK